MCKDCEWFQIKIRIGTQKKHGPVSGLKSAGPHGRFQSFGAAGPVSYPRDYFGPDRMSMTSSTAGTLQYDNYRTRSAI